MTGSLEKGGHDIARSSANLEHKMKQDYLINGILERAWRVE
jgi:hypothetical protein